MTATATQIYQVFIKASPETGEPLSVWAPGHGMVCWQLLTTVSPDNVFVRPDRIAVPDGMALVWVENQGVRYAHDVS